MTPEQLLALAVDSLTEEFDRPHADPKSDAQRFLSGLLRAGWRPHPVLADRPGARRQSTPEAREAAKKHLADVLAAKTTQEGKP